MATDVAADDFVTIVPVGEGRLVVRDPSFVTVLTVGAAAGAAEVTVCRPRGERLGLGLKFEGGSAAAEKVRRLLVQSCAEDSPAANARTPWGKLIPGDEILAIDGESVSNLTRIDCVRRLKDSDEVLSLLVRHFECDSKTDKQNVDVIDSGTKQNAEIIRPTTLPPPVPPRKLGKKNSFKDKQILQTVEEKNLTINESQLENLINGKHSINNSMTKLSRKSSFDSHIHRQAKESFAYLKKGSPEEVRRLVRRLSDGKAMPPEAEVYIDLLSTEWERCLVFADAESDDTGSSISTVVDRLGSMTSSVDNSIPSTPTMQPKTIDIQKVLNCIENIDTNILKDITSKRFMENQIEKNNVCNGQNQQENTKYYLTTEEVNKKNIQNDKNNNNTIITGNMEITKTKNTSNKTEISAEKPKPMPRITKIERSLSEKKPRPIPVPEIAPPPVPETLLTPTKKNCIETWLQRSEAEMKGNKTVEKIDDSPVPEALPRLIDFVPKNAFKDNISEPPLTRPTTAPPPPPTETREDGSGASLDTIGELDEPAEVTDSTKPADVNKKKERNTTFERSFWEDRTNKSDAEDKSLSNDETPLPTCPRQPPDGVETPSEAIEKTPEPASRMPPRLPAGWPGTRPRLSYTSRSQDPRSEASVKDKIAMFSNDHGKSSDPIDKCGTLPTRSATMNRKTNAPYTNTYSDISSLDRRLTKSQDNLDELPRSYKRHTERPEALGGVERLSTTPSYSPLKTNNTTMYESKPLFYGSTTTLPTATDASFAKTIYHARSVSDDNSNKNMASHKSNLEYLIEQRKKSMSKLRGLVIPEVQTPIVDLPEIKIQDPLSKSFLSKANHNNISHNINNKSNKTKPIILNETKWKTDLPNNLPKYSPAFKRKSLQVYTPSSLSKESTPEPIYYDRIDSSSRTSYLSQGTEITRGPLETNALNNRYKTSTLASIKSNETDITKKNPRELMNYVRDCKNLDIKLCTVTDVVDSDNDSAMSSTQSSYRSSASSPMHNVENIESDNSRLSPRISHYATYSIFKSEITNKTNVPEKRSDEYIMKRNVSRSLSSDTNVSLSSSAGSAATSGSQASCSSLESSVADSDKRKVSKNYNIDTINRRNILASAKCRSGRDAKLKSPVVETKFSQESCDRSPSPVHKTSDRLSSLTSSVSAMSNKGENRRRNKVIAETDSDSDSDINMWQRKNDFKNSRPKRNSFKNKQIDTDIPKEEDGPKIISEKIIKEIKKAGLDDYKVNHTEKRTEPIKKSEIILTNKQEKNIKKQTIPNHKSAEVIHSNGINVLKKKNEIDIPSEKIEIISTDNKPQIPTQKICLRRGSGSGVGVILAGGIDCEAKEVTVHRVLADSVAAKAGLKRGAKVRSINGCDMAGLTHAQSVTILKEQRLEVIIEIDVENQQSANGVGCGSQKAESKARNGMESKNADGDVKTARSVVTVLLEKAGGGAGLGFGLDGGRDSPRGDCPLTIKKLFAGGAAAQSGHILVGAELLSAGGQSMEGFTRTQAWAALKALPTGPVTLVLRNP